MASTATVSKSPTKISAMPIIEAGKLPVGGRFAQPNLGTGRPSSTGVGVNRLDNCNHHDYLIACLMKTSCRFAMAVHVLAVLAYREGDRVTSTVLAGSINT